MDHPGPRVSSLTGTQIRFGASEAQRNFRADMGIAYRTLRHGVGTCSGDTMDATRHSGIVDGLEAMKAAGLIIRYNLSWERRDDEPRVAVWRACDTPDEQLRRSIADGLAGLLTEAQLSIVPSAERAP